MKPVVKKITVAIGAIALLIIMAMAFSFIPGKSVQQAKKAYRYIPEEIKPVWSFCMDDKFPDWTQPRPFVNPMGGENNYSSVEFSKKASYNYTYADLQNALTSRYVYGDAWMLRLPFNPKLTEQENRQFIIDIEHYIKQKNGQIIGYHNDSIVFIIKDGNDTRWWTEAVIENQEIVLRIVKQDELKIGETLTIKTADYDENIVRFSSYNPGNEYQSIYLEYDQGEVSFEINTESRYGLYKRSHKISETLYDGLTKSFYYDNIMYDLGFSNWEVSWYSSTKPDEIKITLLKTGEIPLVKYGEPLGAIKVSSEHVAGIEVYPVGGVDLRIEHPEFDEHDLYLDQTPDGDFIAFVPAGLWDVKIYPKDNPLANYFETLLVPVNSGEMTTVEVPYSISNALRAGGGDYNERGLSIGSVKENEPKNQVSFNFTLLDSSTKDVLPNLTNTAVMENGLPVKLVAVEQVKTPPCIVLLLDSSGSMRNQMKATLSAAAEFIKGLPADAKITIVDFDDKPKELKGSTKDEALKNLSLIEVGGSTALYESVALGLKLLAKEDRPTLVVFTDGANEPSGGGGSTFEETAELIRKSAIPLFTIGFGQEHDRKTLESFAKLSGGRYFGAVDGEALKKVFEAINERLGSTYEAVYERPQKASVGDIPVVSFVIDTSGSMIEERSEKYGSRIHNVKNLLRQFVLKLPAEVQMQLTEFDDNVNIVQALTTDKMRIIRGLSRLEAAGGTNIFGSVLAGYETLKEIPSTKKMLIYITDAALETKGADKDFLRELLAKIKEEEISILWIGLGIEDADEIDNFRLAAEISGGSYLVTEDLDLLTESFNKVLREVQERPSSPFSNLHLSIEKTTEQGARESYSAVKLTELSPVKKSAEIVVAETIQYKPGNILKQYDRYTADYLSGFSVPTQDTIITKKIPVDRNGFNTASRITVNNLLFLKKLHGVEAPADYRFMALVLEMENILPAQKVTVYPDGSAHPSAWISGGAKGKTKQLKISYLVPDFTSHFSLSYNEEGAYPCSLATWLAEKPLAVPGDTAITVYPEQPVEGALVFLVPDRPVEQTALHFYDLNYGHIDIPLVGEMKKRDFSVQSLPTKITGKLSEAFSLEISGYDELKKIPGTGTDEPANEGVLPGSGAVFKVVEGNFISQMQALLNIDPLERFSLRIKTADGDFYIPVSPATNLLPAGFANPRVICPGSFNKIRWLFEMPEGLEKGAAEIFIDLKDDDKTVGVADGTIFPANRAAKYKSRYADLTVNDLVRMEDGINGDNRKYIIADLTIHDKKDGYATDGIGELFSVVNDDFFKKATENFADFQTEPESGGLSSFAQSGQTGSGKENRLLPDSLTEKLILGFTAETPVYDGTSRRGLIVFRMPEQQKGESWYLYSEVFDGLKLKTDGKIFDQGLLGFKTQFETESAFAKNLNTAISLAIEKHNLNQPDKAGQLLHGNMPWDESAFDKQEIPVPTLSLYGAELLKQINSVEEMISVMKKLRYIPSSGAYAPFQHSFSKEALLTQGFGMEQDFAKMAMEVLARLGYQPKPKVVKLTGRGKEELGKMSGVDNVSADYLPAVAFMDEQNNYRVLVLPFLEELAALKRLVYLDYEYSIESIEKTANTIRLEINAWGNLKEKSAAQQISDFSGALAGDTEGGPGLVSQPLFNDYLPLDILSLDAVDIGIAEDNDRARVYLIKADGEVFGEQKIELADFDVQQLELVLALPHQKTVRHQVRLDEGMGIGDIFMTVSINAPDLTKEAAAKLQKKASEVYKKAENPSGLSTLRWYGRSIISKFIYSQTTYDRTAVQQMNLVGGRIEKPRVIVVTHKMQEKLQTSLSLLQVTNEIHAGKKEALTSFHIMSGIYATALEASVLSAPAGGLEKIWAKAPKNTKLILLDGIGANEKEYLIAGGMSGDLISYLENLQQMILITDQPSLIDGQKRWAWLEIDPQTFEMISVLDTLEKGAFVEGAVVDTVQNAVQYAVGAFKGVETSVWSVAAFSLEKDDYKEILKAAKALALGLADKFEVSAGSLGSSIGGTPSLSQAVGPVQFSFDGSADMSQNVLSFTDGYKAGVEYYFKSAR